MYTNIGQKIMKLAKVIAILGIIGSAIAAIGIWVGSAQFLGMSSYYGRSSGVSTSYIFAGILVLVVGSLGSWIGSFLLYGFGQLVQDTALIADMHLNNSSGTKPASDFVTGSSGRY